MGKFGFKVSFKDKSSKARIGKITTPHGVIQTPAFTPVGTQASVKSLTPRDLKETGTQMFFGNTYHLHLRPGEDVVEKFGGLGRFMGWDGPTITDSGGFQIFSLGDRLEEKNPERTKLIEISDNGVKFRSHLDGSLHYFTPEESIRIQHALGADLIIAFDECLSYFLTEEQVESVLPRIHNWEKRSLEYHEKHSKGNQFIYGVIQGAAFKDLRKISTDFICSLDFDGFAIGGVANAGESKKDIYSVVEWVTPELPEGKPRHLLGVGEVDDIFEIIERGIDTFDCVIPTRLGRTGFLFVDPKEGNIENRFRIDINKSIFAKDQGPVTKDCGCYVCQNFTRGYLNHLFRSRELLAYRLASYHNIYFINNLVEKIRDAILNGEFKKMKREWLGGRI
ncbi:MAG: tRNA guanosine(34) transglycosylase Tgt [Patescibacteria group bacterium]|nr:tRNA guanosine(34) transglycosylase Tgt [Patescibacteria group bacterium]